MLQLKTRKSGNGVVIFELSGKLTIGEPVLLLRETLRKKWNVDEERKFLVDLGQVSYIDSSGLGELQSSFSTVRNKGGSLKLLKLTSKTKDLLQMKKLLLDCDNFYDEAAALASLNPQH